jgi:AraC-like DNA-binding protein
MVGTTGAFLEIFGVIIFIDLFKVFYMGLTFLTILLSVFTIQRPHLFSENENLNQNVANRQSATLSEEEQKTNKMDYEFLANYLNAEKPYLKTDLKMQDLVEATGLSYKRISELFNNEFNKSFFDVMNEFRLQEAMRLMAEKFHIQHTLPYLAERAGFNSKTTFNRIFKKYTGQTPSDYIKTLE